MVTPHNLVRISGTLPGGEVWSINPRFSYVLPQMLSFEELSAWAEDISELSGGTVFDNTLRALLSSSGFVTTVRVEQIDATGVLADAAQVALPSPVPGQGAATKTHQTACVVSLLTGRPGRSFRGRIFLPAIGATISESTLRLMTPPITSVASAAGSFLQAIATIAPTEGECTPVVFSPTRGTVNPVTSVSVGNVLDTQRRRRDALVEDRSTVPVSV